MIFISTINLIMIFVQNFERIATKDELHIHFLRQPPCLILLCLNESIWFLTQRNAKLNDKYV